MTPEFVIGFMRSAIELTLSIILPIMLVSLAVGIIVSILQAATQIQEQILSFVPKIITIFAMLLFTFPLIMDKIQSFTINLFLNLPEYIK